MRKETIFINIICCILWTICAVINATLGKTFLMILNITCAALMVFGVVIGIIALRKE